jgi:hypothetical protein
MDADQLTACPGCGTPLKVPAAAVGTAVGCPHCPARFRPAAGGPPALLPARRRMPSRLMAPAAGLLLVGLAGVLVNGYIAGLTALRPEAAADVARGMVQRERVYQALAAGGRGGADEFAYPAHAAAAGVAAARLTRDAQDELLAAAQAEGVRRRAGQFLVVSLVATAGGLCMVFGRLYPLAVLGCVAALLNLNHMCFVPGLPVGVYGLLTLARDDVRPFFRRP